MMNVIKLSLLLLVGVFGLGDLMERDIRAAGSMASIVAQAQTMDPRFSGIVSPHQLEQTNEILTLENRAKLAKQVRYCGAH
jgi:hypothetical protein